MEMFNYNFLVQNVLIVMSFFLFVVNLFYYFDIEKTLIHIFIFLLLLFFYSFFLFKNQEELKIILSVVTILLFSVINFLFVYNKKKLVYLKNFTPLYNTKIILLLKSLFNLVIFIPLFIQLLQGSFFLNKKDNVITNSPINAISGMSIQQKKYYSNLDILYNKNILQNIHYFIIFFFLLVFLMCIYKNEEVTNAK
ncbi:MAG: hypothetical protein Ta2D_03950 [Rickettsiales bacterium]|nr:MAG: hypothetical protein Ta2D_03950 [Rickettsiales bacterium]